MYDVRKFAGYRVHVNPGGAVVFLEGHTLKDNWPLLTPGMEIAIEATIDRRGLRMRFDNRRGLGPNSGLWRRLGQLGRIVALEHSLCGEENW